MVETLQGISPLVRKLELGFPPGDKLQVTGLTDGQKAWFLSLYLASFLQQSETTHARLILLCSDRKAIYDWLEIFVNNGYDASIFGIAEAQSLWGLQRYAQQHEVRRARLEVLADLLWREKSAKVHILSYAAYCQTTLHPEQLQSLSFQLIQGEEYDIDHIKEQLQEFGYRETEQVTEFGQYALRGGLIDYWGPFERSPIRLEFLGDFLESMRSFAADTQLSEASVSSTRLVSVWEADIRWSQRNRDVQLLYEELLTQNLPQADRQGMVDVFAKGGFPVDILSFMPIFRQGKQAQLAHYLRPDDLVLSLSADAFLLENYQRFVAKRVEDYQDDVLHQRPSLHPKYSYASEQPIFTESNRSFRCLGLYAEQGHEALLVQGINPRFSRQPVSLQDWIEVLKDHQDSGLKVLIFVQQEEHLLRMKSVLQHHHLAFVLSQLTGYKAYEEASQASGGIRIAVGVLQEPVWDEFLGLLVLSEHHLFQEKFVLRKKPASAPRGAFQSFQEIKVGSLVVHRDHGLALYQGMKEMELLGVKTDFLILEFQDQDRIYLPVHRLNLLQRFSVKEGAEYTPQLDKLKSPSWQRKKAKASQSIRDLADELLHLYAQRKLEKRAAYASPSDHYYQFEADFPYTETADQQRAIDEVNADLSSENPMDRLVCGDVGFGKTEVALRAALRVVENSSQVMILAPTTLLSYQHYENFAFRFHKYGYEVGLLNRFVKSDQIKKNIEKFQQGSLDILIGTHRILSKDVKPKRLGLLVVDEEQRFGVGHKEEIKKIKASCDVLALTATPIPRSLHMSLLGIRDISVIATPPKERLGIKTYIANFDGDLVRKAILLEKSRGGQIFFVHNRVHDLGEMLLKLQALVPEVRMSIAHGQMKESKVEEVILDFIGQKFEVLICTTIIESGIDMPNVNTIIINKAEHFGLSQLYQMRGRVGRSSRQAYCYFLTQKKLGEQNEALARLNILVAHQELGLGFQIASYDMEMRGTGNLLGGEQSGNINDIGFDLYMEMLEKEILRRRGETQEEELEPEIKIKVSASLPASYIREERVRLSTYKNLFSAAKLSQIDGIAKDLKDRFGTLPTEACFLLSIAKLKIILKSMRSLSLAEKSPQVFEIRFAKLDAHQIERLTLYVQQSERAELSPDFRLLVTIPSSEAPLEGLMSALLPCLDGYGESLGV